MLYKKRKKT